MTLYVKTKAGEFVPLKPEAMQTITRAHKVRALQSEAMLAEANIRFILNWVRDVKKYRQDPDDLLYARIECMPDETSLLARAVGIRQAMAGFKRKEDALP